MKYNPLLTIQHTANGLQCDAPGCGYIETQPKLNRKAIHENVNRPCPRCGASLLTEKDAAALLRFILVARILNIICFPVRLVTLPLALCRRQKLQHVPIKMDGTGKLEFEKKDL